MKIVIRAIVIVSVVLMGTPLTFAQDTAGKVEVGGYGLIMAPQKGNFDTAGGGGGYLRYFFTENIALESALEYAQWDFSTSGTGATGTLTGDLDVLPLLGTLQYHFNTGSNFSS